MIVVDARGRDICISTELADGLGEKQWGSVGINGEESAKMQYRFCRVN